MGLSGDEMRGIIDDLYAATGRGDWAAAEAMLTDDFFVTEADGLPMAGLYRGKGALQELFTAVMGMMEVSALDRGETTTGTDRAVTILSFRFADPTLAPGELCEVFHFRDGKVCEIKPYYFDPRPMIAAHEAFRAKGERSNSS